jgi:proline dehydrogenase
MRFVDRVIAGFLPYTPKFIVGRVAQRYIAGETMEDAIRVARGLNAKGFRATMDILGEDVHRLDQARAAAKNYRTLLDELDRQNIDSNVSVKLTAGPQGDKGMPAAGRLGGPPDIEHGNFVRIDMEDSSHVDALNLCDLRRRHGVASCRPPSSHVGRR